MSHVTESGTQILVGLFLLAAGIVAASWRARVNRRHVAATAARAAAKEREATFAQIEALFKGSPANPLTGEPATPGLVPQINAMKREVSETKREVSTLRTRQEEIAHVAQQAGEDVAAVRSELTRNGGSSTKDAAHEAHRASEAAAAAAELARQSASNTEDLMRRHMENGVAIMQVGVHNDGRLYSALAEHGVEVTDVRPYPPVDTGD